MRWKEIGKYFKFKDGSQVTQKHQVHLYDCYEIEYDDDKIVLSKDHLIQVDISNMIKEMQDEIIEFCSQGKIALKEDIRILSQFDLDPREYDYIYDWVVGEIEDNSVEDLSTENEEIYLFKIFGEEILIKVLRIVLEEESQKISGTKYWIPVEGLAYLFGKYGPYEI